MMTIETAWDCCGQPYGTRHPSCTVKTVEIPGPDHDETLPSVPYEPDYGGTEQQCHDCGISRGGYHHPGCDMERCPKCGGQLIGCGCLSDDAYNAWQRAKARIAELEAALAWYAERRNYNRAGGDPPDTPSYIALDQGRRARAALGRRR